MTRTGCGPPGHRCSVSEQCCAGLGCAAGQCVDARGGVRIAQGSACNLTDALQPPCCADLTCNIFGSCDRDPVRLQLQTGAQQGARDQPQRVADRRPSLITHIGCALLPAICGAV